MTTGLIIFGLCCFDAVATRWESLRYPAIEGNPIGQWMIANLGWLAVFGIKLAIGIVLLATAGALWNTIYGRLLLKFTYKPTGGLTLGSTNGAATISQSTWFICTITHTNNYTTCYTNNVLYTNNTGEAISPVNCFGFGIPSGNTASAGYQELMIFNDELSTAQKLTVYNFFKTKYGL